MIAPARLAAYEVLRAVNSGQSDLPSALARVRRTLADERDRALAGEIAAGTLRWQAAFDAVVAAFAGRAIDKLDREILDILRLTAFQILHLDRIPVSAAVNDAVDLARRAGKKSAAGLVNAILRRISRERNHLPLPKPEKVAGTFAAKVPATFLVPYLATTLSHPEWLVTRWLQRYGFAATEAWELFDNSPAALTLRANTLRTSRAALAATLASHGVETTPTRFAPHGLTVTTGNPLLTPLAADGLFLVQDEASQLIAELTAVSAGERVLDACASPGGKTTAMAASMGDAGFIVATDLRGKRVDLLRRTISGAGATCARVVQANVAAGLPFRAPFDCVLLDAPCSGLGTLRRDPDIRWRRTEASLGPLAATQIEMLERTAALVKPRGRLVYATCSSEPDENEQVVERFLSAHPEFVRAPEMIAPQLERFRTPDGDFRTYPFRDRLEAFFAAMLVKTKDLQ
jgi:16S rRNA (cytosine967-C5)-methyltransferase